MNDPENKAFPKVTAIPKLFYSDLTNAPFKNCINCNRNLLEEGVTYLIEKAVKGFQNGMITSTVFEYAVCIDCAENMNQQLSRSSKQNIDNHFKGKVNFKDRIAYLKDQPEEKWIEECLIHKEGVNEAGECQLYGLCQGEHFIYQEFPYMIRSEAIEEMLDLLSAETLDQLDDFKNDLTSGPPELRELFEKGGPRVLI